MPEELRISIMAVSIAALAALAVLVDRQRSSKALTDVDRAIERHRIVRIEFVRQLLVSFAANIPAEMRMRMHRRISEHAEISDEESEIRWERIWMPEMHKLMAQLEKSVSGPDRETFMRTKDAFETNERLLSEALDKRDSITARISMRIGGKPPASETL